MNSGLFDVLHHTSDDDVRPIRERIHILEGGLAEARDDRETLEATARDVLQLKRALEDERRQQTVFVDLAFCLE